MEWTIEYYNEKVQQAILELPPTLFAKYLRLTKMMLNVGANLGGKYTKAMGEGLFEIQLTGTEGIARVFYCTIVGQRIVMLHSFIKKTQKNAPPRTRIGKRPNEAGEKPNLRGWWQSLKNYH